MLSPVKITIFQNSRVRVWKKGKPVDCWRNANSITRKQYRASSNHEKQTYHVIQ